MSPGGAVGGLGGMGGGFKRKSEQDSKREGGREWARVLGFSWLPR